MSEELVELVERVLDELNEENLIQTKKKGEWWYQRLNDWHDLEKTDLRKGIVINVKTDEYLFAQTPQAAMELAKRKFGLVPFFAVFVHPYVCEELIQVVGAGGEVITRQLFYSARATAYNKRCEQLYYTLGDEIETQLKSLPRSAHAIISAAHGAYVIGENLGEAEERMRIRFPVLGREVYGPSTLNGRATFVAW